MRKKIIVIGAGLAGLAACSKLVEYGFDTIILEARNRIGGRVSIDNTLGIPLGLGANWIHGIDNNPIANIAKKVHGEMIPFKPSLSTRFNKEIKIIPYDEITNFDVKFNHLLKRSEEIAFCLDHDVSLASVLSVCAESENFSENEWDLYKQKLYFFENYIGASFHHLSARYWSYEEPWPGENCFLASSYEPILRELAKNCLIHLNTRVTELNLSNDGVEVITERETFQADAVVITLPLGVLQKKDVTFNPPLPSKKQDAINRLGMGLLDILVLKFPSVFWPKESPLIYLNPKDDTSITTFFNLYYFTQQPILVCYYGGDTAYRLENMSDAEIIEKATDNLKRHFASTVPDPEQYLNTRWATDPFSFGSYSYLSVGSKVEDYNILAEPIGNKFFFAGEATCAKHFATTHGAYLSGIREAERIKTLLN